MLLSCGRLLRFTICVHMSGVISMFSGKHFLLLCVVSDSPTCIHVLLQYGHMGSFAIVSQCVYDMWLFNAARLVFPSACCTLPLFRVSFRFLCNSPHHNVHLVETHVWFFLSPFGLFCCMFSFCCWSIVIGFACLISSRISGDISFLTFEHLPSPMCILRFAIFVNVKGQYGHIVDTVIVSGCFFQDGQLYFHVRCISHRK